MGAMDCLALGSGRRAESVMMVSSEQLLSRCVLMSFSATVREHIGLGWCKQMGQMVEEQH